MTELKRCWRCGGRADYVGKSGYGVSRETEFISCDDTRCMPLSEKYTVEQWQKRAIEDELEKKIAELEAQITFLKNNKAETYTMPCDPQWIPVSVPPKEGKKYWVVDDLHAVYKAVLKNGKFFRESDKHYYVDITHYMERGKPKPPK